MKRTLIFALASAVIILAIALVMGLLCPRVAARPGINAVEITTSACFARSWTSADCRCSHEGGMGRA